VVSLNRYKGKIISEWGSFFNFKMAPVQVRFSPVFLLLGIFFFLQKNRLQHSGRTSQLFWTPYLSHETIYTVQKEQGVRLVSLMQREIILYMASAICVSSYLADFYLLSKFASLE
jgi:hypothetical protein